MPLVLPPDFEQYVKKIASYCEKRAEAAKIKAKAPDITKYDKITAEQNIELYDILLEKLTVTAYKVLMSNSAEVLRKNRDIFVGLSVEEQTVALKQIVGLFGCNVALFDLTAIKGSSQTGRAMISMKFSGAKGFSDIRIIDQSPTGLIERRSDNLLEL